jgi:hypothetical protein
VVAGHAHARPTSPFRASSTSSRGRDAHRAGARSFRAAPGLHGVSLPRRSRPRPIRTRIARRMRCGPRTASPSTNACPVPRAHRATPKSWLRPGAVHRLHGIEHPGNVGSQPVAGAAAPTGTITTGGGPMRLASFAATACHLRRSSVFGCPRRRRGGGDSCA